LDKQGIILMDGPGDIRDYFDKMDEFYNKKMAEYCKNLEETYLMEKQIPMLERWAMDGGFRIVKESPKTKVKAKRNSRRQRN